MHRYYTETLQTMDERIHAAIAGRGGAGRRAFAGTCQV